MQDIQTVDAEFRVEKRITVILKQHWDGLLNERRFPAENDINKEALGEVWRNCFIVEASNASRKEDYKYKYLGENIIKAYGRDLTGLNIKLATPEASHLAREYERVLALKRPVIDTGEINISKDEVIKYRQILLPLGDDGVNINAIWGGMSYKVDKREKRFFFFSFGSKK